MMLGPATAPIIQALMQLARTGASRVAISSGGRITGIMLRRLTPEEQALKQSLQTMSRKVKTTLIKRPDGTQIVKVEQLGKPIPLLRPAHGSPPSPPSPPSGATPPPSTPSPPPSGDKWKFWKNVGGIAGAVGFTLLASPDFLGNSEKTQKQTSQNSSPSSPPTSPLPQNNLTKGKTRIRVKISKTTKTEEAPQPQPQDKPETQPPLADRIQDIEALLRELTIAKQQQEPNKYLDALTRLVEAHDKFTKDLLEQRAIIMNAINDILKKPLPKPPTGELSELDRILRNIVRGLMGITMFFAPSDKVPYYFSMQMSMEQALREHDYEEFQKQLERWRAETETDLKERQLKLQGLNALLNDLAVRYDLYDRSTQMKMGLIEAEMRAEAEKAKQAQAMFMQLLKFQLELAKKELDWQKRFELERMKQQQRLTLEQLKATLRAGRGGGGRIRGQKPPRLPANWMQMVYSLRLAGYTPEQIAEMFRRDYRVTDTELELIYREAQRIGIKQQR